jgi:hypothetical protein
MTLMAADGVDYADSFGLFYNPVLFFPETEFVML